MKKQLTRKEYLKRLGLENRSTPFKLMDSPVYRKTSENINRLVDEILEMAKLK